MTTSKVCRIEGCQSRSKRFIGTICMMHYHRLKRTGELGPPHRLRAPDGEGTTADGYRRITTPDGRLIMEHRYFMELHLGRPLLRVERIHHVNGIKTDNRLENLELWVITQPSGQRLNDLLDYMVEYHADELRERLDV